MLSYPLTLVRTQQCTQSRLIKADTEADLLAHRLSGTEAPESAHKDRRSVPILLEVVLSVFSFVFSTIYLLSSTKLFVEVAL